MLAGMAVPWHACCELQCCINGPPGTAADVHNVLVGLPLGHGPPHVKDGRNLEEAHQHTLHTSGGSRGVIIVAAS